MDGLNGGASYDAIAVTVNVAADAPSPLINDVLVGVFGAPTVEVKNLTIVTTVCDLDVDGNTNVADVQRVVNAALGLGCPV